MMRFELYTEEKDERPVFITGNFNNWNPKIIIQFNKLMPAIIL
jgi:hypothetical protein